MTPLQTEPHTTGGTTRKSFLFVGLVAAGALVALVLTALGQASGLADDSCPSSGVCNEALADAALQVVLLAPGIIVMISTAIGIWALRTGRPALRWPLIGGLAMIATFVVAQVVLITAVG